MRSTEELFLDYSARKLQQLSSRIESCLNRLSDEQVWTRGAENENAAGNLVLHLCGNLRQWILSGVAGQPDQRQRDAEFAARSGDSGRVLATYLRDVVGAAVSALQHLQPQRLTEHILVQSYDVTVMEAVYHVVEHFSGHTGQIIFLTKLLTGEDLGFYGHLKTTAAHSEQTP